jgi:ribosomal protein L11 methyltransferase
VVYRIAAPQDERERLLAELSSLGTLGVEEREAEMLAYFRPDGAGVSNLQALADPERRISVSGPERVPDADWEREWRSGLAPRLVAGVWIRPSFCASAGEPELVIDPQQAFGSGEHASTRLALKLLLESPRRGSRSGSCSRRCVRASRSSTWARAAASSRSRPCASGPHARSASTPIRSRS